MVYRLTILLLFIHCGNIGEAFQMSFAPGTRVFGQLLLRSYGNAFNSMPRERVHVPSKWIKDAELVELIEPRYQTEQHEDAVSYFEERLTTKLGYTDHDLRIPHDYFHYLLMDLLAAEGIPLVTDADMKVMSDVQALLGGKIPDLIIKSNGITRRKPLILDVVVKRNARETAEKKRTYGSIKVAFDVAMLSLSNYNSVLNKILTKKHVDYFHKQVGIFSVERAYWMSCLKFKRILFNNSPIESLPPPSTEFTKAVEEFRSGLSNKAAALVDNDGI